MSYCLVEKMGTQHMVCLLRTILHCWDWHYLVTFLSQFSFVPVVARFQTKVTSCKQKERKHMETCDQTRRNDPTICCFVWFLQAWTAAQGNPRTFGVASAASEIDLIFATHPRSKIIRLLFMLVEKFKIMDLLANFNLCICWCFSYTHP